MTGGEAGIRGVMRAQSKALSEAYTQGRGRGREERGRGGWREREERKKRGLFHGSSTCGVIPVIDS